MITIYTGTPGSGKSYHACAYLLSYIKTKPKGIIANFPVSVDGFKLCPGARVSYWDNSEITPARLAAYSHKYHKQGVEGQTLLVVDEAQVIWNARTFQAGERMAWIKFFSQHRKLGYNILMVSQNDRMIDKQIRMLIEYEVKHRKLNNYGAGGFLISFGHHLTIFIALTYWYGGNKLLINREIIRYRSKIAGIYDTMRLFTDNDLRDDYDGLTAVERSVNALIVPPKRRILPRVMSKNPPAETPTP